MENQKFDADKLGDMCEELMQLFRSGDMEKFRKRLESVKFGVKQYETNRRKTHKPKFKQNQYVVMKLSNMTVLYKVRSITGTPTGKYYNLIGIHVLSSSGGISGESRQYNPYADYADDKMRLASEAELVLYGGK